MGVITKLVNVIKDDAIRAHINEDIDTDFIYCGDWEVELHHANIYLNKLLNDRLRMYNVPVHTAAHQRARRVLRNVSREQDVSKWADDIALHYFPLLETVWSN